MAGESKLPPMRLGTFRDPQGRLYQDGNRILREIYPQHIQSVLARLNSAPLQLWMQQRKLVPTWIHSCEPEQSACLEHERIFFPSYPWEWSPGQWHAAASLSLDLCEEALEHDLILKDATPLNILFSGAQPVFVDVLSFDTFAANSPLWLAHAQFVRTFLLPLAAYAHLGWPLAATAQRRDGYEPTDIAPWLGLLQRWHSPLRSIITIPGMLEWFIVKSNTDPQAFKRNTSPDLARHAVRRTLRILRRQLTTLARSTQTSRWSNYTQTATHYAALDHAAKQEFVSRSLTQVRPQQLLDVGANTGVYSRIAADCGANVVAWDSDVTANDLHWRQASKDRLPILPIVADFARPTPAIGWQNRECSSLLARAAGRFDCVLMLGILHHLLIAEQIPLTDILDQVAEISTRWAVLEWIPSTDSQFISLCRGREALYSHLNEEFFLQALSRRFLVRNRENLSNGRSLWLVEKSQ